MKTAKQIAYFTIISGGIISANVFAQLANQSAEKKIIRISQYNPNNVEHAERVEVSTLLCANEFHEHINAKTPDILKNNSEDDLEIAFTEAVRKAGNCAYRFAYNFSAFEMRRVTNTGDEKYSTVIDTPAFSSMREAMAAVASSRCKTIKYKVLGEILKDKTRIQTEVPKTILNTQLYCMSLLGRVDGVQAAMSYFKVALD